MNYYIIFDRAHGRRVSPTVAYPTRAGAWRAIFRFRATQVRGLRLDIDPSGVGFWTALPIRSDPEGAR